jgi:hypothetical protein
MNLMGKGLPEQSYEVQMIRHLAIAPQGKWDLPQSTAQEVGWLTGLVKPRTSHQIRNKDVEMIGVIPTLDEGKYTPRGNDLPPIDKKLVSSLKGLNSPRWRRPKVSTDVTAFSQHQGEGVTLPR